MSSLVLFELKDLTTSQLGGEVNFAILVFPKGDQWDVFTCRGLVRNLMIGDHFAGFIIMFQSPDSTGDVVCVDIHAVQLWSS